MLSHLKFKMHICESKNMQKGREESFTEPVYLRRERRMNWPGEVKEITGDTIVPGGRKC